ncbi:Gfo/Idh/MocA family protein [Candidatus Laterigemmans baculatus]|uniref:Gfo/Idh/MocA family protein n=1 Tax=Candidatus Laterigemmans baculatus TaxID=2770505 RepID=UPI0013D99A18|nr:Gfo/Idh/MocA family oxidoreductase [Candidatus Laterigemmans baculatus]
MTQPAPGNRRTDLTELVSPQEALPTRKAHPGELVKYRPQRPDDYDPGIVLVGCGGIARHHLEAYRDAGLSVTGLVDVNLAAATALRDRFYPDAQVFQNHHDALRATDAEVFDVATHPQVRPSIIRDCLRARRHVLSQKPFVLDLDVGQQLVELADEMGVYLAVNQNGRWAPHFSYMREAVAAGLLGETFALRMSVDWDHTWVAGTAFEHVKHLVLYDYAIHWFDMVRCLLPNSRVERVYATTTRAPHQAIMPALLGQVLIELDNAQATMTFDAIVRHSPQERTYLAGTQGVALSLGKGNNDQQVTLTTDEGAYHPNLIGKWFPDGFRGTMCELLSSIREKRPTLISAADNLQSLGLCFAAIDSAQSGEPKRPGQTRQLPG